MELKVIVNPLDGAGPGRRLLSNLFYGCGYNFYRCERQLHADDLLIRGKLGQLLQECRAHLRSLEAALRDRQRAPQDASKSQAISRAQLDLAAMETAVSTAKLPEMSRIHQRHREERGMLAKLVALDGEVLLALVTLRDAITRLDDAAAAAAATGNLLRDSGFSALWSRREALLLGQSP